MEEKVGRIKRHFDHALEINVVLTVEKLKHNALPVPVNAGTNQPHYQANVNTMN